MGSPKKQTIGYWYRWLMHMGWCRPVDALLELRAGGDDYTLWSGRMTASGRLSLDKPNLWGGEKGEGGVKGDMDVCFGEQTQAPNDYLRSQLGDKQSAHRGKFATVLRGARWGAFTANPKTISAKVEGILNDWQDATVWYPEKAQILIYTEASDAELGPLSFGWRYKITSLTDSADYSTEDYDDADWSVGQMPFASAAGQPYAEGSGFPAISNTYWPLNTRVWLRRTFNLNVLGPLTLSVFIDNTATVWVNGQLVLPTTDTTNSAHEFTVPTSALRLGQNTIVLRGDDDVETSPSDFTYAAFKLSGQEASSLRAMNPAHMLYQSITEPDMQGEPVGLISDASFRAAADQLYAEGFGLCTTYDSSSETPEDFQQRICNVIGASLSQSRVDGLYYLDLVRAVTDIDSLPVITEDDVIEYEQDPSIITESTNSVSVTWTDPQTKQDRTTAPVRAAGTIRAAGIEIVETKSYPEIPVESLALRVAARDLRSQVMPLNKHTLTTLHRFRGLRPGLHCRLQLPSEGITDMVCVVGSVDHGRLTDSRMQLVLVQDVFALPDTVYAGTQTSPWVPPDGTPKPSPYQIAVEAPYIEIINALSQADVAALPSDAGYVLTAAARPAAGINYTVATAAAGEDYEVYGIADWCPTATIKEAAGPTDTLITLANMQDLDRVALGSWALWDDEIVRVDAIDSDAGTVTLGRGCADTVPQPQHVAGSRIYFADAWGGSDGRQYVGGDTVSAKLLTNANGELSLDDAPRLHVVMNDRFARPYSPGQFRVNGQHEVATVIGDVTLTGVHRDRVQQADQLVDSEMPSVGPEAGTTYTARYYINGALVHTDANLTSPNSTYSPTEAGVMRVEFESVRDGLASYQMHVREFTLGQPLLDESGAAITTEDLQTIVIG